MKVLIISTIGDTHADAVRWGLISLGYNPILWNWENFPKTDSSTLKIEENNRSTLELNLDGVVYTAPFDVIWVRRKGKPRPMDESHPEDITIIQRESVEYIESIIPFLGNSETHWINDFESDRICSYKTAQLIVAAELGFRIPDTLIGNDFEQVASFFNKHNGQIVFKAFYPGHWKNEDGSETALRTSAITIENISNEFAIHACPAIYQELIEKKYELRVTVIGENVLAAAIYSQEDGSTIDWRFDGGKGASNLKSTELPSVVSDRCLAICRKMGLTFGCIDLIADKNDEIVFLEINNVGQFLWKEHSDPNLPMLDTFCRYLVSTDKSSYQKDKKRLTMVDYDRSEMFRSLCKMENANSNMK